MKYYMLYQKNILTYQTLQIWGSIQMKGNRLRILQQEQHNTENLFLLHIFTGIFVFSLS